MGEFLVYLQLTNLTSDRSNTLYKPANNMVGHLYMHWQRTELNSEAIHVNLYMEVLLKLTSSGMEFYSWNMCLSEYYLECV
jgi:hypothetical protein